MIANNLGSIFENILIRSITINFEYFSRIMYIIQYYYNPLH
jgi:hypothetical protein